MKEYSERELKDILVSILDTGAEGTWWDYKQEWHIKTVDLVKDIICLSNSVAARDCFIFIGIQDDGTVCGINESAIRRRKADVINILSTVPFASENRPTIDVVTIKYSERYVDVLIVFEQGERQPFYLSKIYPAKAKIEKKEKFLCPGAIYMRTGDSNTSINETADQVWTEYFWKKKFGLLKPPLEFLTSNLDKDNWTQINNNYYLNQLPEYVIKLKHSEVCKKEFYSYNQCNSYTTYGKIILKYNGTKLYVQQTVTLDSGILTVVIPTWSYIQNYDTDFFDQKLYYKFYEKDSIDYKLNQFLIDQNSLDHLFSVRNLADVVLIFNDEDSRKSFEFMVENLISAYPRKIKEIIECQDIDYIDLPKSNDNYYISTKFRLQFSFFLKKLQKLIIDNGYPGARNYIQSFSNQNLI